MSTTKKKALSVEPNPWVKLFIINQHKIDLSFTTTSHWDLSRATYCVQIVLSFASTHSTRMRRGKFWNHFKLLSFCFEYLMTIKMSVLSHFVLFFFSPFARLVKFFASTPRVEERAMMIRILVWQNKPEYAKSNIRYYSPLVSLVASFLLLKLCSGSGSLIYFFVLIKQSYIIDNAINIQ